MAGTAATALNFQAAWRGRLFETGTDRPGHGLGGQSESERHVTAARTVLAVKGRTTVTSQGRCLQVSSR